MFYTIDGEFQLHYALFHLEIESLIRLHNWRIVYVLTLYDQLSHQSRQCTEEKMAVTRPTDMSKFTRVRKRISIANRSVQPYF